MLSRQKKKWNLFPAIQMQYNLLSIVHRMISSKEGNIYVLVHNFGREIGHQVKTLLYFCAER